VEERERGRERWKREGERVESKIDNDRKTDETER